MNHHVYVSNSNSAWLSHFLMNGDSGRFERRPDVHMTSPPGAAAADRAQRFMFVSQRQTKRFESFSINRSTGALTSLGAVDLEGDACYVRTDNTDRYLLSAYYGAGRIAVHRIETDGRLSAKPLQWIATAGHAHSIQTDRSNRFAFVPHTNPRNAIYQFRFDASTGALTPNDPPTVGPEPPSIRPAPPPQGPRHFVFHPTRDILYSVNEDASSVTAYSFDAKKGTLSPFQLVPTLPSDFSGRNSTAEIRISRDGRHLYASNRGHHSVAIYSVAGDGSLTAKAHQAVEPTPRFFDFDPSGRFLYSAGQGSGKLGSFKVDVGTGLLEPLETHDVGEAPLWIQFIKQS